nr:TIR-like protein FxsC [Micromonospora sp. DSM 115978]
MLYFFLSYARGDDDIYVKKFFDELTKEVRNLTGDPSDREVGFLDARSIRLGASWSPELVNALSTCRVFVSLCSPAYFRRDACGKEWQVFAHRVALNRRTTGAEVPALIPLIWTPMVMPELAARLQYHTADLGEAYRKDGLRQLVRLNRRAALLRLVSHLARQIVETAEGHRLPGPGLVGRFDEITNAFAVSAGNAPGLSASPAGSRRVHFVVAAPNREQIRTLRRDRACYGETYADWAPYRPSLRDPLARFAQLIAERQRFDAEVGGIDELPDRIDRANQENHVLVLLVDAWSARLTEHREALRVYDERNEPTTGVLIPLPRADKETEAHRVELVQEVLGALARNNLRGDALFKTGIETHGDFDSELQNVLEEAQNRIYRRGRPHRLPPGESPGESPILEGP